MQEGSAERMEKMELGKVEVSGVCASAVDKKPIPRGIVGATVEITYTDPLWDGLTKTVVFWGCCVKDVVNPEAVVEIPAEVVAAAGYRLRVGVYGVDAKNNLVIPTLWADLGHIEYSTDPSGDETTDPQLPVWVRLKDQIGDLNELETNDKTNLVAAVNEVRNIGSGGGTGEVNGGGETWRLLNSVVTEEDVDVLSITADSEGKPFALKKVKVFARIRGNTSGAASWTRLTVNNLRNAFYTAITNSFAVTDGQDYFWQNRVDISIHDGYAWCDLIMRSNNNAASKNSLQFFQLMGQEGGLYIGIKKIESIDIYASGAGVGAGSEIVIWGVDAE